MDTFPVTARSVGRYYMVDGNNLERAYKNHLSGYRSWEQLDHAADWMLLDKNIGVHLSIDETSFCDDLFTILSNKEGHGRQGSIIAAVRGTKASEVIDVLEMIPEKERLAVTEVTMDFSDSMYSIVSRVFPNATIVIDCFHIMKRCGDALEEIRLREKRQAIKEQKKERADFARRLQRRAKARKAYRKEHPKTYRGKKRGPKPKRLNERFKPAELSNGDTKIELLTRSRGLLSKSRDKWSESQKTRADLLFELYPKLKEGYDLINSLRNIFKNKTLDRDMAKVRIHEWYQKVAQCTLREIKSARDAIKQKEDEILNYFINRSTNAAAEALNAKMKGFRSQLHGVSDLPFFMYRLTCIFG